MIFCPQWVWQGLCLTNITTYTMKLLLSLILTGLLFISLPSAKLRPRNNGTSLKKIVIDAGHGGLDPGCNGANEIWEKAVTLSISLKLGKLLEDSMKDVQVIYTRKTDKFVELWERPNIANKENADLFISIHCNSNVNTTAAGSETYFMGLHKTQGNLDVAKRENAVITYEGDYKSNENYGGFDPKSPESHIIFTFLLQSMKFSQTVENSTNKISKIKTRGVKQAGFLVLWQTSMPSVLIETGFLTNMKDRAVLKSDSGQRIIAKGIFAAIKTYKKDIEKNKAKEIPKAKSGSDSAVKSN
jgi:N-acetylmuramoyl-L-alanine amidase